MQDQHQAHRSPPRDSSGDKSTTTERLNLEVAVKSRVRISKSHEFDQAVDDRPAECRFDLFAREVMSVDGPAIAVARARRIVILTGEQAHVIDLRNAAREELDCTREKIRSSSQPTAE
jgi:hypothetical protein